jgi:hypothetical protein
MGEQSFYFTLKIGHLPEQNPQRTGSFKVSFFQSKTAKINQERQIFKLFLGGLSILMDKPNKLQTMLSGVLRNHKIVRGRTRRTRKSPVLGGACKNPRFSAKHLHCTKRSAVQVSASNMVFAKKECMTFVHVAH